MTQRDRETAVPGTHLPGKRPAKTIHVTPMRFAAGWRLLESGQLFDGQPRDGSHAPGEPGPLVIDVLRPLDLVGFTIEAHGCDLVSEVGGPVLRPRAAAEALLVVRLPYQHLAEQAIYEQAGVVPNPGNPAAGPVNDLLTSDGDEQVLAPVPALPARASRLVFAIPVTESIAFSTAGLLAALQRLPMVLHPLAEEPGKALAMSSTDSLLGPVLHLPSGLAAVVTAQGLVVNELPPGAVAPDESTGSGLSVLARDLRRARRALASRTGTVAPGVTVASEPAPHGGKRSIQLGSKSLTVASLFGRGGLVRAGPILSPRPVRPIFSRPPEDLETSIEAPFRLAISPASDGHWRHANEPVAAAGASDRVELWHTRLYRPTEHDNADGHRPHEGPDNQRIVRAVWARDRERHPDWRLIEIPHDGAAAVPFEPFRTSLDGADRSMLVRQSTETIAIDVQSKIEPTPIEARKLWLSSLGAWLDLHGVWDTGPYSGAGLPSILLWDHVAPLGRDQFVRVVYPGYLFPFGHKAALVKITERKMKSSSSSLAGLYQRNFLVIGEPIRTYSQELREFPFDEVRLEPLVTPNLDPPADPNAFVPFVGSRPLQFVLHCHDRSESSVNLPAPLVWVADSFAGPMKDIETLYKGHSTIAAAGQAVAFAPVSKGGDTAAEAVSITFRGTPARGRSTPRMERADVRLPAVEYLSAVNAVPITYAKVFLDHGFTGPANRGEVWAEVIGTPPILRFGGPAGGGPAPPSSAVAGGFLQPSFPIEGLSRASGTVGDVKGMSGGVFEPTKFLQSAGISGKLFGFIPLDEVTVKVDPLDDLLKAPQLISLALDRIEGLTADLGHLSRTVTDAVTETSRAVQQAGTNAAQRAAAEQTLLQLKQHSLAVNAAIQNFLGKLQPLAKTAGSAGAVAVALAGARDVLVREVQALDGLAPTLPPAAGTMIRTLARTLRSVLASADVFEDIFRSLNGLAQHGSEIRVHMDWKPELRSWPADEPILVIKGSGKDNLLLSLGARFGGIGPSELEVVAELRDFALRLFGAVHLVTIEFDRLSFHFGTSGKTDAKVQLHHIVFGDCLAFAQPLADLFPLDGFSDPPALDASPEALTIGYTLVIPNIQMGVFTLMNLALGADIAMPFDGGVMTIGLGLSSRERPFTVAVVCIGGGGWVVTRVGADGIKLLELGIEAGACVAMDFGVASGSVMAMIGIYVRLEGEAASFTAYFRLSGEVSVLGIGSASLDTRIALTYEIDTGKLVGSASVTVQVEAFGLSTSRTFACKRAFGTRASDPTFRQVLDVADDGTSPHWFEYCNAFAGA
jgi:hypothetical protein